MARRATNTDMTKRQREEIDFLCTFFGGKLEDAEDYISATVHGTSDQSDKLSGNSLRIAKTKLDRNIKMWREDLDNALLFPSELEDDFGSHPFGKRMLRSLFNSTLYKHEDGVGRVFIRNPEAYRLALLVRDKS